MLESPCVVGVELVRVVSWLSAFFRADGFVSGFVDNKASPIAGVGSFGLVPEIEAHLLLVFALEVC